MENLVCCDCKYDQRPHLPYQSDYCEVYTILLHDVTGLYSDAEILERGLIEIGIKSDWHKEQIDKLREHLYKYY